MGFLLFDAISYSCHHPPPAPAGSVTCFSQKEAHAHSNRPGSARTPVWFQACADLLRFHTRAFLQGRCLSRAGCWRSSQNSRLHRLGPHHAEGLGRTRTRRLWVGVCGQCPCRRQPGPVGSSSPTEPTRCVSTEGHLLKELTHPAVAAWQVRSDGGGGLGDSGQSCSLRLKTVCWLASRCPCG